MTSEGRVIFRFRDVNAQKVVVNIAGAAQPLAMEKDTDGVWSPTSGPMRPDLYSYTFNADGVTVLDPSNAATVPNLLNEQRVVYPWQLTRTVGANRHSARWLETMVRMNEEKGRIGKQHPSGPLFPERWIVRENSDYLIWSVEPG